MCAELSLPNYYNIEAKDTPSQLPLHESCPPRARRCTGVERRTTRPSRNRAGGGGPRTAEGNFR